jgi:hypothetical protein
LPPIGISSTHRRPTLGGKLNVVVRSAVGFSPETVVSYSPLVAGSPDRNVAWATGEAGACGAVVGIALALSGICSGGSFSAFGADLPGKVNRDCSPTTTVPPSGLKTGSKLTCFASPPITSQGSQKLYEWPSIEGLACAESFSRGKINLRVAACWSGADVSSYAKTTSSPSTRTGSFFGL